MDVDTPTLDERLLALAEPPKDPDLRFHAITLTADAGGAMAFSTQTRWIGFEDAEKRIELRESRLVTVSFRHAWEDAGQAYIFATDEAHLLIFMLSGGNALVEASLAERIFGHLLGPHPCYCSGELGFVGVETLEPCAFKRAPSPKLRMRILKRDRFRCRICGRSPDDNTDVVLHVHHIRPWENRGLTSMSNLITLCHTCHIGLDPHFDRSLFEFTDDKSTASLNAALIEGTRNYRSLF